MTDFKFNPRLHWTLATIVLLVDVLFVATIIHLNKFHYVEPPVAGTIDTSAVIGWISVLGGIFIFGCYGVLIKTPSVEAAKCDCMVFQCYYSIAVAFTSVLIWLIAGGSSELTFTPSSISMGVLFGVLWITSQGLGFNAIQTIGYAAAPAIWIGVTITVSFAWGVVVFGNPVKSSLAAVCAISLLLFGVVLAALSSKISDAHKQESAATEAAKRPGDPRVLRLMADVAEGSNATLGADQAARNVLVGVMSAVALGLCNGSLMVSMTCFQNGCLAIGVEAYTGHMLAPLAFLPSLAIGILVAQPVLFFAYWGRSMARGVMPQFHFSQVGINGLLTGAFWAMGNFSAMFATVYLGQTIGFPLTQCCLVLNGAWGILYYKEIVGRKAIGMFVLASIIVLSGASIDGMYV